MTVRTRKPYPDYTNVQCALCGTVRADWQPPCDVGPRGRHKWEEHLPMKSDTGESDIPEVSANRTPWRYFGPGITRVIMGIPKIGSGDPDASFYWIVDRNADMQAITRSEATAKLIVELVNRA